MGEFGLEGGRERVGVWAAVPARRRVRIVNWPAISFCGGVKQQRETKGHGAPSAQREVELSREKKGVRARAKRRKREREMQIERKGGTAESRESSNIVDP